MFPRLFLLKCRTGFIVDDACAAPVWVLAATGLFVRFCGLFPDAIVIPHSARAVLVDLAIHAGPEQNCCINRPSG